MALLTHFLLSLQLPGSSALCLPHHSLPPLNQQKQTTKKFASILREGEGEWHLDFSSRGEEKAQGKELEDTNGKEA